MHYALQGRQHLKAMAQFSKNSKIDTLRYSKQNFKTLLFGVSWSSPSFWIIAKLLCLLDTSKKYVHKLTLIPTLSTDQGLAMGQDPGHWDP
jgi:hypothetical protein